MLGDIYYSLKNKKVLTIFFILSGVIFQPLLYSNMHFKITYALMCFTFIMVNFYALLSSGRVNKVLLLAIFSLIPSFFLGLILLSNNETTVVDYISDIVRYIAPFLGFTAAIFLVGKMKSREVEMLFVLLFSYEILKMLLSIFNKLYAGGDIVQYLGIAIYSSGILVIVFGFDYFFKGKRTLLSAILLLLSLLVFVMMPFVIVSKSGILLLVAQSIIIFYLIYKHIRLKINRFKYFIILFLIALIVPILIGNNNQTMNRFEQALDVILNNNMHNDSSTSARTGEITGVLHNFSDTPSGVIFGIGNGSWILAKYIDEGSGNSNITGLPSENYREKGKYVHHVHSGIFAILNRNGLIGLLAYFYFFYHVFRLSKKLLNFGHVRFLNFSKESRLVYLYGVGSVVYLGNIIEILPNNGMYGAIYWGVKAAMIPIVFRYLSLQYKVGKD